MFCGGRRSLPRDRKQVFARLDIDARLGQRRTQLRVPVQAAIDLLEAIAAILNRVVGAEQSARHVLRLAQEVAAADSMVADPQFAAHPLNHAIQIAASRNVRQERRILLLHRIPIGAVHVRRVEVVAIDPPGLIEYLGPLDPRVDADFDRIDVRSCPGPAATLPTAGTTPNDSLET